MTKYVFKILAELENEDNGTPYYRIQCQVSGDVMVLYNQTKDSSGEYTRKYDFEEGDYIFSTNAEWEKSDLGSLLNGLFMQVDGKIVGTAIFSGEVTPMYNTLTKEERKERKEVRDAKVMVSLSKRMAERLEKKRGEQTPKTELV